MCYCVTSVSECVKTNIVKTRYWDSQFQYGSPVDTLLGALNESLKTLQNEKMIQLSMDGPHVNWLILSRMQNEREEAEHSPLEDAGSCGLHIVSGAFQSGVKDADWGLEKVLRGMWKLLDKSPARRGEYLKVCKMSPPSFPQKFCVTRWVENEPVATRAIELWSTMVELIKTILLLPVSKRPKNNQSFDTLVAAHRDSCMLVKLHIFRDIASILSVFFTSFQSDAPLMPFLADELEELFRKFMKFFLLKNVVSEADTPYKLIKLDINDSNKQKPLSHVKLPTSAQALLVELPNQQQEAIKKGFIKLLKKMLLKLQERSPLKYILVRSASCLSPMNMAKAGEKCCTKFGQMVNLLHKHKRISGKHADAAKDQFELFIDTEVKLNINKFRKFDHTSQRLDKFLGTYMIAEPKYKDLWQLCIFVFVLSHGQAQTERGFNVNKDTEVENLQEQSLIALRFVYDEILDRGGDLSKMIISSELSLSCQQAYRRYNQARVEKIDASKKADIGEKRKLLQDEYAEVKRKKLEEEDIISSLKISVNKYIVAAAEEENSQKVKQIVVKMKSFNETISQKTVVVTDLEMALEKLDNEISQCK